MFHRGTRYSALGVMTILGMVDCHITKGSYKKRSWRCAFKKVVLPHLGEGKVLVMDNCPNLHNQRVIIDMVHDVGARVEFLEPYDPHHMPIELGFRAAKDTLRREQKTPARGSRRERLRQALLGVNDKAARSAFRECGYDV
jgi:transposase